MAGGIRTHATWSGSSCASGRGGGGACSLSPSSAPSAARLWALRGYCPTRPWAMSRSSTGCWSWPTRKAPAGCRCARASAGAMGSAGFAHQKKKNSSLGTSKSGLVGRTVSAQLAPAPLWDSSSARDAESRSANPNTRLSRAAPALRCQPRLSLSGAHRRLLPQPRPLRRPKGPPRSAVGSPGGGGALRRARPHAQWVVY